MHGKRGPQPPRVRQTWTNTANSVKRAAPLRQENPVFAVKFINKRFAEKYGRIKQKQLQMETSLHKHIGLHRNIIEFYDSGEDQAWTWIAMELAEGGDLFDKIEADSGVAEDIAHVYFSQLVGGIAWMHSKGVAHRDIKPENILLSADGELKLADFGMATLFEYGGKRKMAVTLCGSPPYVAPEVLSCSSHGSSKGVGYAPDLADTWSCGIVLFVLLAGNTPWAKPVEGQDEYGRPNEFALYLQTNGNPKDELWEALPTEVLSLLRGMMRVETKTRFSLQDVRRHPWFTRLNKYMDSNGRLIDPVTMATSMFESLHVSFDSDPLATSRCRKTQRVDSDAMDIDGGHGLQIPVKPEISATQPVTPGEDMLFDWEKASDRRKNDQPSATQPTLAYRPKFSATQPSAMNGRHAAATQSSQATWLEEEPSMSQFTRHPQVPLSRTQLARKFHDILPNTPMTKFYSMYTLNLLIPLILESLTRLGVPLPSSLATRKYSAQDTDCVVKVKTVDSRGCQLSGSIIVEVATEGLVEVEFVKGSGDPLEWRRLFKKVVILCQDAVYKPEE